VDWISQHGGDKYYRLARRMGEPSRAYFKLLQLDKKHHFLSQAKRVIDLGSAPGGWLSYVLERVGSDGKVVAVDIQELRVRSSPNLVFIMKDVFEVCPQELLEELGGRPDVVLSDLAPRFTGIRSVDVARQSGLVEKALELATQTLVEKGWFVTKLFMSPEAMELVGRLKREFRAVSIEKPPSSRRGSSEIYAVCRDLTYN